MVAAVGNAFPPAEKALGQRVDRGSFRLYMNGREAGTEEFEIRSRGEGDDQRTTATGAVSMQDGPTLVTTLLAQGRALVLQSYRALRVEGADTLAVTLERARDRLDALIQAPWGEEVREYRAPLSTMILEDGVAHHHFVLGALLQGPFPALHVLSPVSQKEVDAEAEAAPETIQVDGAPIATTRVRVRAEDEERLAWFDGSGRLVRVELPARGFVAERVLGSGEFGVAPPRMKARTAPLVPKPGRQRPRTVARRPHARTSRSWSWKCHAVLLNPSESQPEPQPEPQGRVLPQRRPSCPPSRRPRTTVACDLPAPVSRRPS